MKPSYHWIFNSVAPHYEEKIVPVLGQLAADLVKWVTPQPHEIAVDLGTGTGIAARLLAPQVKQSIGVDFVFRMVTLAHQVTTLANLKNGQFLQGNAEALPIQSASVDLVISSFGFNATDPFRVFPEVQRMLKKGGRFCLQEWGGIHPLDTALGDVLQKYAVDDDDAPSDLVALRDFLDEESPWYNELQTEDDYHDLLSEAGFVEIEALEHAPITLSLSVQEFIGYKLSWTARAAELAAMDASSRADCLDTMRQRLYEQVDSSGKLTYNPRLFRVSARRS